VFVANERFIMKRETYEKKTLDRLLLFGENYQSSRDFWNVSIVYVTDDVIDESSQVQKDNLLKYNYEK
jgi:hypothetical protein